MTGYAVAALEHKRRLFLGTALLCKWTARMEATAAWRIDGTRHVPLKHNALASARWIRRRRQQGPRVRMSGVAVQSGRRGNLDDLAQVHHRDAVADVLDHAQVVRDEEVGELELVLQVEEQVEDLRLDRHVERGDRLVGNDELRVDRKRAGDADALALAAGELVRIAVAVLGAQADQRQQVVDARSPLVAVARGCGCAAPRR